MAITFVRSKYGGMVPNDHPDADPGSGEVDPSKTTAGGDTSAVTPAPPPPGTPGATGTQGAKQPYATASNTPAPEGTPTTIQDAYRQSVMKLLTGPTPDEAGTAANVNESAPVAAYRNEQLRGLERDRAGAAEMSGINGTQGSGGFLGEVAGLRQLAGENTANYAGQQANKVMDNRRAELLAAVQMAQQAGQFDQAQQLQKTLADLDASIRNRGIDVNQSLGSESNANQRYSTDVQKMLGMTDAELRRYLGEMQNSTNRYGIDVGASTSADRLGLDYTDLILKDQQERDRIAATGGK